MSLYFKTPKKLISALLIIHFFYFGDIALAQTTDPTSDDSANVGACVTDVISVEAGKVVAGIAIQEAGAALGASLSGSGSVIATAVSVPVADAVGNITLGTIQGITNVGTSFQNIFKMELDALAYGVAQCALEELTNNTVAWIQGGFQGSPGFAVDVNKLFGDIEEGVLEDFSNQIRNLEACDFTIDFKYDLADAVETSATKANKFPAKIKCPFSPQTVTATQFYNDRSSFSWKLMETALSDRGNRFGVSSLTTQEAARRQAEAKAKEDQKLGWSNGFADLIETDPSKCNYPTDIYDSYLGFTEKANPASSQYIGDAAMKFIQRESCPTTTPGKVVGDSLMKAVGAKQDRIGFVDNMNKVLEALIMELTTEATKGIFKSLN